MTKRNQRQVVESRREKKMETGRVIREKFQSEVKPPVKAKTAVQKEFLTALKIHDVVVFSAPAGVGKTFLIMCEVSDWLKKGIYDKVVLTRAVIPMGRSLGMLPNRSLNHS